MTYREALARCLEAARDGRDVEAVIARLPARYAPRLRADSGLAEAVRRYATALPLPDAAAERAAAGRLQAELAGIRSARGGRETAGWRPGPARYAVAALVVAAVLAGAAAILGGGGGVGPSVEAATVEGVVVAAGQGSLTVQTLDRLEEVTVPLQAVVSDGEGSRLDAAVLVGQVVVVHGHRPFGGGPLRAEDVRRLPAGLPGWCADHPARCRQIAHALEEARERCRAAPAACRIALGRVEALIEDAKDVAALEELKQRCAETGRGVCRDFVSLCRLRARVCLQTGPAFDRLEEARERLRGLVDRCEGRDVAACRQVAQICGQHAALCPEGVAPGSTPAPVPPQRAPGERESRPGAP